MSQHQSKNADSKKFRTTISPSCRVKVVNAPDLVDCLTEAPFHCEYRLSFGSSYYCHHPQRLEIAARTSGG